MSKKIIVTLICLSFGFAMFSQKQRVEYLPSFDKRKLHYGFYLGMNQNDFVIRYNDVNPNADLQIQNEFGFNVGLIADYRLHKNINLRFEPGLMTNTKKITFTHLNGASEREREASSTFLHIPVLLKFSTDRLDNVRPYILAGLSYDYNFSSNQDNQDDNSAGEFRMKTHNFMYEVGVGIDIYLYFFKFSPSIRGVFAFNNELTYDDDPNSRWTAPIDFLGTRGVFINLAFE